MGWLLRRSKQVVSGRQAGRELGAGDDDPVDHCAARAGDN